MSSKIGATISVVVVAILIVIYFIQRPQPVSQIRSLAYVKINHQSQYAQAYGKVEGDFHNLPTLQNFYHIECEKWLNKCEYIVWSLDQKTNFLFPDRSYQISLMRWDSRAIVAIDKRPACVDTYFIIKDNPKSFQVVRRLKKIEDQWGAACDEVKKSEFVDRLVGEIY